MLRFLVIKYFSLMTFLRYALFKTLMRSDWLTRQQYFALIGLNSNSYFKTA